MLESMWFSRALKRYEMKSFARWGKTKDCSGFQNLGFRRCLYFYMMRIFIG